MFKVKDTSISVFKKPVTVEKSEILNHSKVLSYEAKLRKLKSIAPQKSVVNKSQTELLF